MPSGKLLDPGGPGAQSSLGSIQGTDGNIYPFNNNAAQGELKEGDPIIFYLTQSEVKMDGTEELKMMAVAQLDLDQLNKPCIVQDDWNIKMKGSNTKYKNYWKDEWEKEDEEKIAKLQLKDGFKDTSDPNEPYKKGLKKIEKIDDIRKINKREKPKN